MFGVYSDLRRQKKKYYNYMLFAKHGELTLKHRPAVDFAVGQFLSGSIEQMMIKPLDFRRIMRHHETKTHWFWGETFGDFPGE